ncbi:MAG TPA: aquaporin [Jatrophihabitans sp.]|nr:aquaporin [Jatrophihabitans sp.]
MSGRGFGTARSGLSPTSALGALAAELLGTFAYVWIGTATVMSTASSFGPNATLNTTAISVAFGFAVLAAVYVTAPLSGAHLNPAVTIALTVIRKFPVRWVAPYIVAQMIGGLLAALANWGLFGDTARKNLLLGATVPGSGGAWPAFCAEILLGLVLMITVMATAVEKGDAGPVPGGLGIGLVVGAGIFAMLPISGGSFNPARTFGPMIVSGQFPGWGAYVAGPIGGAVIGALLWQLLRRGRAPDAPDADEPADEAATSDLEGASR